MRTGILGGAFNPPHIGHLVCAQEALVQVGLEGVLFVPMGRPPHRELEDDPGRELRFRMCEQAIAGDPRFTLSRIELEREGPAYTVDTLRQLRSRSPGDELVLILGGDRAVTFPTWREPEEILRLATVAVAGRSGFERSQVEVALAPLAGADGVVFFDMPTIDVSSSLVRRRVGEGRPVRYLVPDAVAELIGVRGLYGAASVVAVD